jgi:hypothetical protein
MTKARRILLETEYWNAEMNFDPNPLSNLDRSVLRGYQLWFVP